MLGCFLITALLLELKKKKLLINVFIGRSNVNILYICISLAQQLVKVIIQLATHKILNSKLGVEVTSFLRFVLPLCQSVVLMKSAISNK